jgi:hypothetical protein
MPGIPEQRAVLRGRLQTLYAPRVDGAIGKDRFLQQDHKNALVVSIEIAGGIWERWRPELRKRIKNFA